MIVKNASSPVVTHHVYAEKGRTAAPALPHGTPNQKGVTFTAVPNPFDRFIKNNFRTIPTWSKDHEVLLKAVGYTQLRNRSS